MRSFLSFLFGGLLVCACLLLPSGAAGASAGGFPPAEASTLGSVFTLATPTDSASTPGPVDPGTGETPAAKETRVDYAPYVIAAAVLVALAAAIVVWRRARGGPSSKSVRRARDDRGDADDRGNGR
jgi:hypothetical protein